MARPIKNTPILYGESARRFERQINNLPSPEERMIERQRVEEGARRFEEFLSRIKE